MKRGRQIELAGAPLSLRIARAFKAGVYRYSVARLFNVSLATVDRALRKYLKVN